MGGGEDGAGSGLNWATVREWPAVIELQQQHGSGRCRLGERAGEGRGKERERVERAGELGSALMHSTKASWRTGVAQRRPRGSEGERVQHAATKASECTVNTVHQIQISNSTSKIQLKPIFRASVTPKPRRVSKNSINKSYRSTYHLQLFLSDLGLIRKGYQVASSQSQAHRNCKLTLT